MTPPNPSATRPLDRDAAMAVALHRVAYGVVLAAIYGAYGLLWYFAAKGKLLDDDGTMPAGLKRAFDGTIVDAFPGLDLTWVLLALLQALILLTLIASLLRAEFLPRREKPLLVGALALSLLAFALMIFGQELIGDTEGVAQQFGYLAATGVALLVVLALPPSRGLRWPVGDGDR